jgi:hypothetical protein
MYRANGGNEHINLPNLHSREVSQTQMTYSLSSRSREDENEYRATIGMNNTNHKKPFKKTS